MDLRANSERVKMNANLDKLGNFQDYKYESRVVVAESPLDLGNPMMVLKFYNMFIKGLLPITKRNVDLAKDFIETEAKMSRLDAESGLGFVIMSEGCINVARWSRDKRTPHLLRNQVYEYAVEEDGKILTRKLDINKDGAFCMFELGVANYERAAWRTYLKSRRELQDKKEYVNDIFVAEVQ